MISASTYDIIHQNGIFLNQSQPCSLDGEFKQPIKYYTKCEGVFFTVNWKIRIHYKERWFGLKPGPLTWILENLRVMIKSLIFMCCWTKNVWIKMGVVWELFCLILKMIIELHSRVVKTAWILQYTYGVFNNTNHSIINSTTVTWPIAINSPRLFYLNPAIEKNLVILLLLC